MVHDKLILQEMWSRQRISSLDVDYSQWANKRESLRQISRISQSCLFTVDVFENRYDFASDSFSDIFGYNSAWIRNIQRQGDLLEERIHPEDRDRIMDIQIKHGQFIYSLPPENRNDYSNIFQFRMLNAKRQYTNVIGRQQVVETDRNGKAWIIMGTMDISPDQLPADNIKYSCLNIKTGEIVSGLFAPDSETSLTNKEIEILQMISRGLLSKEIADRLNISIYTVSNHRKNILAKLGVNNSIEAVNKARDLRIIY